MSFQRATVLAFESRRAKEIAELIRINEGQPLVAPALREVPVEENTAAFSFADKLYAGEFDMMIFLTGVGTRYLREIISSSEDDHRFLEALRQLTVVARGPKPTAVLREWNVPIAVSVPEPNTWRELLAAIAGRQETSVAVQEYGRSNTELIRGLQAQGRRVTQVPVYRWTLPEDTGPLTDAVDALLRGRVQVVLFTTGVQIEHLLELSDQRKQREDLLAALRSVFVASIGPDCTQSLRDLGITAILEPSHPKMGILVREAALAFASGVRPT
jgi:uroporphyrinogen-III synthase